MVAAVGRVRKTVTPKRKRRIVPRQPNVGAILPVVQRMIAIDALLVGDGLIIDLAAEELGVVGRSVRRSLDILRELAGPTVFEIDEATVRHRHRYAKGVKAKGGYSVGIAWQWLHRKRTRQEGTPLVDLGRGSDQRS